MRAYIDGSSKGLYGYKLRNELKLLRDYPMSNNQAEWLALLYLLMDLEPDTKITIFSDSQIVVNQYAGLWETKDETLKHLKEVCRLVVELKRLKISLKWVCRKENEFGKYLEKLLVKERRKRKKFEKEVRKGMN